MIDGRARPAWRALTALCALASLVLGGCGSAAKVSGTLAAPAPATKRFTLRSADGRLRSYIVHAPLAAARRRPLVLVFHGAGGTAEETAQETDFVHAADQSGFVVAFLQGYRDTWNEDAGDTPARAAHVDDVEFTAAALSQIEQRYPIDRTRVAAAGFSNGALLAELLGCRLSASLTLVAPVAGPIPVAVAPSCRPAQAISVLEFHGTADQSIPYGGGHFVGIGGGTTVLSAPASAAFWAARDGCARHGQTVEAAQATVLTTYSACRGHVLVELRSLQGAGHGWPGNVGVLIAGFLHKYPRASASR